MNLRDLQYLVALAEHRHFGQAAEATFVSQPTLSTQIKKLEAELGVTLVERGTRRVLLTKAGDAVVERARTTLAGVDDIKRIARRFRDPEAQSVRLGIFPTLGPYLLPHILPPIRERHPKLELLLVEEKTEAILARLHEGRLDAVIVALPAPTEEKFETTILFDEPFVLAVPDGHELAGRATVATDDLIDRNLLLLEEGHCLRDQALDVCRTAGAAEYNGFRATSLETLRYMVAGGVGITLLPVLAIKPPTAPIAGVRMLAFRDRAPSRRVAMLWRKSSTIHPVLTAIADIVQSLPNRYLQVN